MPATRPDRHYQRVFSNGLMIVTALLPFLVILVLVLRGTTVDTWGYRLALIGGAGICVAIHLAHWVLQFQRQAPESAPPIELTDSLRSFATDLDSADGERRRSAIQALADSGVTPVAGICCWPIQQCSDLQLAAAEALLREWLDHRREHPRATEAEVVEDLFPFEAGSEPPEVNRPRVRRLAPTKPAPPNRIVRALDEWSETIKDRMLDWDVKPPPEEHVGTEGEDCPLAPLDRAQFAERLQPRIAEALGFATDTLAAATTDYDLLLSERAIQPLFSTLRWEAIAAALELRQPEGGPVSVDELRDLGESLDPPTIHAPHQPRPTGDWVQKYRRMRATGI